MDIHVIVAKKKVRAEQVVLASDAVNVDHAYFAFDEEWDGFSKTAVFTNGDVSKQVVLTDCMVPIPSEVMQPGYLDISVVGYAANGEKRLTTAAMQMCERIKIQIAQCGKLAGEAASTSTPEYYEQLLARVGALEMLQTQNRDSIVAAVNEIVTTMKNFVTYAQMQTYVSEQTQEASDVQV